MSALREVWVVRDDGGNVIRVAPREHVAVAIAAEFGGTVTRETILTPAHAAVIEAAKALREANAACVAAYDTKEDVEWARGMAATHDEWLDANGRLFAAVATLREQEAET